MRKYDSCLKYSDLCLQIKKDLMDYNGDPFIIPSSLFPIKRFNREVIMYSRMTPYYNLTIGRIDSVLYKQYDSSDLRKTYFFSDNGDKTFTFRGNYDGGLLIRLYNGITTDEVYLMRAECYARLGKTSEAMNDLNTLLIKRWKSGTFIPFTASSGQDAINKILSERRKELLFRDLRWIDIKRLNKENGNITLKRSFNGKVYQLTPNDGKFALPLPNDIVNLAGIAQNPR